MTLLRGWLVLVLLTLANGAAFFGARAAAATRRQRGAGLRRAALGLDASSWEGVTLARGGLYILAGPAACYLVASLAFLLSVAGGEPVADVTSMRVGVAAGGAAAQAGFHDGDKVLTVGDAPVGSWDQLRGAVRAHAGETLPVTVERGQERLVLLPAISRDGKLGIAAPIERKPVSFGHALGLSLAAPARVNAEAFKGWLRLIAGAEKAELSGPVGMMREAGTASGEGRALVLASAIDAYFLWIPTLGAIAAFPWRRRGTPSERPGGGAHVA